MQSLLPKAKGTTQTNFAQSLERSCYLTCGPRWARDRGPGPFGAARGRRNPEQGKFLSVGLPSLQSWCGPQTTPSTHGRDSAGSAFQPRFPTRSGAVLGKGKIKTAARFENLHSFPSHWAVHWERGLQGPPSLLPSLGLVFSPSRSQLDLLSQKSMFLIQPNVCGFGYCNRWENRGSCF